MCSFESCSRNLHKCMNENRNCLQGCSTELIERLKVDTNDLIKNTKGVFEYNSLNPQLLASALIDLSSIYHKKNSISSISTSISSQIRLSQLKKPTATVGHFQLQSSQQQYHQIILQHQQSSTRLSLADIQTPYSTTDTVVKETTKNPTIILPSMIGNSVSTPAVFPAIDQYRLQLYNYAMVERLRCVQYPGSLPFCPPNFQGITPIGSSYGPRFSLSMSLFHNRAFQTEEPKPQHSYIGLIAMAILSSPEAKLVLSDIYQHILDNYPYFRTRGPGWRNSIRHNLSLNDCFIKAGRSANGKGHYWAIHPANIEDFKKGDFRRRKAQRKVRRHMGLAVDDEGTDSPSPPLLAVTPPSQSSPPLPPTSLQTSWDATTQNRSSTRTMLHTHSQSRKRQFDVASLLAPDEDHNLPRIQQQNIYTLQQRYFKSQDNSTLHYTGHTENLDIKAPETKRLLSSNSSDEDIDVEASDVEDIDSISKVKISDIHSIFAKRESTLRTVERHNRLRQKTFPELDKDDQIISREEKLFESPTMVPSVDATVRNQLTTPSPSSSIYFQDVMQKWPSSFSALGIKAMDPRIFGRYYGQCVAAAASRRVSVVGSLLNAKTNTNSKFTSTGEIDNTDQPYFDCGFYGVFENSILAVHESKNILFLELESFMNSC